MSVRTQAPGKYSLWEKTFGPRVTRDDVILLKARAEHEGWLDWLEIMLYNKSTPLRKRRMLAAYLRDGLIEVEVHTIRLADDDDPYEGMGG